MVSPTPAARVHWKVGAVSQGFSWRGSKKGPLVTRSSVRMPLGYPFYQYGDRNIGESGISGSYLCFQAFELSCPEALRVPFKDSSPTPYSLRARDGSSADQLLFQSPSLRPNGQGNPLTLDIKKRGPTSHNSACCDKISPAT